MATKDAVTILTLLYFAIPVLVLARTEHYVQSATSSQPCPLDSCLTLNDYTSNKSVYFTSGATFILVEGEHYLNSSLALQNVTDITFHGSGTQTRIIIAPEADISWRHSSAITLSSMEVSYYGTTISAKSAFLFEHSHSIQVLNVVFTGYNSEASHSQALRFIQSDNININNCSFSGGYSQDGGAIRADCSSISFSGVNAFTNNSADVSGGAISASNGSNLAFTGTNTFVRNRGRTVVSDSTTGGGAIHVMQSSVEMSGFSVFRENGAVSNDFLSGGAVKIHNSVLTIRDKAIFDGNSGSYAGVMNSHNSSILLQGQMTFSNNRPAGGISLFTSDFRIIGEMNFKNNEISTSKGFGTALYSENSTLFISGEMNFTNNRVRNGVGGAFFTFNSSTFFEGDINFIGNTASGIGGALCIDRSTLEFNGSVNFINNSAEYRGGGLYAIDSTVTFSGSSSYVENTAIEGGGMGLEGTTQLVLRSPVKVTFDRNQAESVGGALLFLDSSTIAQCQNISVQPKPCFFKIEAANNTTDMDVYLNFTLNIAGSVGSVLYGGSLQLCRVQVNDELLNSDIDSFQFLKNISVFDLGEDESSYISSDPLRVCFCSDGVFDCSSDYIRTVYVRRGELFKMSVVTVGQGDNPVPSTIRAYVGNNDNTTELNPQSHMIGRTCTDIEFRLLSEYVNKTIVLYPDGPCGNTINTRRKVHVILQPCPPGFVLQGRHCMCEERLLALNSENECDIDTGLVGRPENTWIRSYLDKNQSYVGFILNRNCPLDYCQPSQAQVLLNFSSEDSDSVCTSNRTGILCGKCRQNYSLVMTNYHCQKCENKFLSLLLLFAFAGIALIAMLLTLHMTVAAGTINGLILYANIVNINSLVFFPHDENNLLSVFIAWLNLDFGIETCFYDGLDFYTYAWLEYAFPLYLWFLVGVIIIINKLSRRVGRLFGTNPVAVLATVILMSYTKLMQAVIITLAYTDLEYPDGKNRKVWLFDANVPYFRGKHAALSIVAFCVIIFLLIPYIILLTFGYRLQAYSSKKAFRWFNKLKPLLDAYYAPYNKKTRHWPGCMLVIRGGLYLVFAFNTLSNSSANLVTISSVFTAVAIVPWLSNRIYEKYYLDLLEASFILNVCILSTATYHVRSVGGDQAVVTFLSIGIAFVEFLGIVAFHIYLRMKKTRLYTVFRRGEFVVNKLKKQVNLKKEVNDDIPPKPTTSVVELREPLLEEDEL